jgi:hypothetical protein
MQRFDIDKFNKEFVQYQESNKKEKEEKEKEKIAKLNENIIIPKKLYELSLYDILVGIKDTWFGILDDSLNFQFNIETFTKNNRLFFVGCTFLIIAILVFCYNIMFDEKKEKKKSNVKIINIHHFMPKEEKYGKYKFTNSGESPVDIPTSSSSK